MSTRRPSRRKGVSTLPWVIVALAAAAALIPVPAGMLEQVFTRGFYAAAQPFVTFVSNLVPFVLLDALIIVLVIAVAVLAVRDAKHGGRWSALRRTVGRLIVWSAATYLAFLALWGFNYRREALTSRLPFDSRAVTPAAAIRLATMAVDRVNAQHGAAHAEGWVSGSAIDPALAGAFEAVAREIAALPRGIVVGRPKRSLLDWYFQRAGVSGMTDPFFLETIVAGDLLPFERPHVVAHEWAHLAGLADEGEANFAAWLACMRGSIADQYSGWLFMYGEAAAALAPRERAATVARLSDGPRADLTAIRERTLRHVSPRISSAGWRVYDSYLKANRVEAGTQSYSDVVRLVLGLEAARQFR